MRGVLGVGEGPDAGEDDAAAEEEVERFCEGRVLCAGIRKKTTKSGWIDAPQTRGRGSQSLCVDYVLRLIRHRLTRTDNGRNGEADELRRHDEAAVIACEGLVKVVDLCAVACSRCERG